MDIIIFQKQWNGYGSKPFRAGQKYSLERYTGIYSQGFILHRLPHGHKRFIDYRVFESLWNAGVIKNA